MIRGKLYQLKDGKTSDLNRAALGSLHHKSHGPGFEPQITALGKLESPSKIMEVLKLIAN
jgi:hypothetical protein